ncbi:MAG: acyltransferase [Filomicrobium sp.]
MLVIGRSYLNSMTLRELGLKNCGENVMVHESCELVGAENIYLGNNVRIDPWCILAASRGRIEIGNYVHIGASCYLSGTAGIEMQHFAGLSQGVKIYSATDDYAGGGLTNPTVPEKYLNIRAGSVRLGRHVIVGSGSIVLPSAEIGEGTAVGALSVVTKSLAPWSICAGVPARRLRERRQDLIQKYEAELLSS